MARMLGLFSKYPIRWAHMRMPVFKGGIGIHGGEVKQRITALVGCGGSVQDGNSGGSNSGRQRGHGWQQDGISKKQAAERGWRGVKTTAAAQYYCMHNGTIL
jgi:hypothetical protein